jgi:gliding motility-associated-like protein
VITDVSCIGLCDGAIDITISGGTPVYTYSWSQGPITEDVSGLCTGDYTITVADANGCTLDSTFTVSEPSAIVIDRVITNVSCKSGSDGAINITLSGGTFPYTYSWSHGPTTEDVSGLTAGDYTITVTDANGCTLDSTFTVSEPAATISIDTEIKTDITCAGKTDGSVTVIASGGTGTLIYTISPGDSSNITGTFINLPPDSYTVSITDGNGCGPVLSNSLVVGTGTYSLSIDNVTVTDISCQGDTNGTVNISVSGGLQPYIYMWSNSETTEDINNLPAGVYSVTVTDANACQVDSADIPVGEPAAIIITLIDSADVSCYGLTDGSINITASGGTGNLVFSKDGGLNYEDNGGIFPGLAAGVYDLFIKDDNSCELNAGTATVSEPEVLTIGSEDMTNITCYGDADGSITVTATGGNSPYTYTLNPGAIETNSTGIFPNLGPGSYTVSVEDNNLCGPVTSGSIEISEPDAITVLDTSITYPIPGFVEGAISIDSISGGISPYTFTLNPGNVSNSTGEFVIQEGGEYTITITDDNGCEKDIDVDLIEGKSAITIFNAFTPNGDGYNEVWNIINIGLYPGNTVRIYNSWGNLVFSSDGYEEPWDGTYNGRVLPADTYYYVIDLGDGSDPYTGSVSIIK